jgi:predicted ferric reductase
LESSKDLIRSLGHTMPKMVREAPEQGYLHRMRSPAPTVPARDVGPVTIGVLAVAQALLWFLGRPPGERTGSYLGQFFGAEAVLLLSLALVLISTLPWVEAWFDGIDRAAIWHRRLAITGLVLLAPHILMSSNPAGTRLGGPLAVAGAVGMVALALWAILPRWQSVVPRPLRAVVVAARDAPGVAAFRRIFGGYERWRALHRTTGIFVAAGFVHGILDGTPFHGSAVLRWSYLAIGGVGLGFYVYRELLARFFLSLHDYQVDLVREIEPGLAEVALRPIGRGVTFVPGQFAMVYLEAKDGWHRHPFTIASGPQEGILRFTIKALGDYTSRLHELIEPGMPAVIGGPHGRFDHRRGTDRQAWIAGGVGVAPFLSWLRALDRPLPYRVDFFYTAVGPPAFADEIRTIAAGQANLHVHLVDTVVEGRLTPGRVLAETGGRPAGLSVFMCGPAAMLSAFETELRRSGVAARHIHREYFDWR